MVVAYNSTTGTYSGAKTRIVTTTDGSGLMMMAGESGGNGSMAKWAAATMLSGDSMTGSSPVVTSSGTPTTTVPAPLEKKSAAVSPRFDWAAFAAEQDEVVQHLRKSTLETLARARRELPEGASVRPSEASLRVLHSAVDKIVALKGSIHKQNRRPT
jgi:hypothetical protein